MSNAQAITAELYNYASPPQVMYINSNGGVARYGNSIISCVQNIVSNGGRVLYGSSLQSGICTILNEITELNTVVFDNLELEIL